MDLKISELFFDAGIGSGMPGNPLGRILGSDGPRGGLPMLSSRECSRVFLSAPEWGEVSGRLQLDIFVL
jgi:hypothetical protein